MLKLFFKRKINVNGINHRVYKNKMKLQNYRDQEHAKGWVGERKASSAGHKSRKCQMQIIRIGHKKYAPLVFLNYSGTLYKTHIGVCIYIFHNSKHFNEQ